MEDSTVSKRELQSSSTDKLYYGSNSTAATIESDWETYLINGNPDSVTVSLSPWSLYQAIRSAKIVTVEPVMFLYFFGLYLITPLFQQYYLKRYSLDALQNTSYPWTQNETNGTQCIDKDKVNYYTGDNTTYGSVVERDATLIFVLRSLASTSLVIITTLIMGPLSDRYGRRVVILLVAVGALLQGFGSLAIVYFKLDLYYFVIIGAFEGLFGNFASLLMACFSYVSDISSGKWRTMRLGIVESVLFLSGLLALPLGGFWFQKLDCDIVYPLYLYLACNFTIIVYTVLFLPESLTNEERRRKNANKPNGVRALVRGVSIFFCRVEEYPVWRLWVALISVGIVLAVTLAAASIGVFFFGDLNWSPQKTSNYQTVATGSHMISLMVILPILVALKFPDPLISLIGVVANVAINLFIGFSRTTYQLFIGEVSYSLHARMLT